MPRSSAGTSWPSPGYLRPSRVLSVEVRGGDEASRRAPASRAIPAPPRYGRGRGDARLAWTNELRAGRTGSLAQLFLSEPVVAVHGQPFVLREESPPATVGGGRVLQPGGARIRRRDATLVDRLDRLRSADPTERCRARSAFVGLGPWTGRPSAGTRAAGRPRSRASSTRSRRPARWSRSRSVRGDRPACSASVVGDLEERVLRALAAAPRGEPPAVGDPPIHVTRRSCPDLENEALVSGLDRAARGPRRGHRRRADGRPGRSRAEAQPGGAEAQGRDRRRRFARGDSPRPTVAD